MIQLSKVISMAYSMIIDFKKKLSVIKISLASFLHDVPPPMFMSSLKASFIIFMPVWLKNKANHTFSILDNQLFNNFVKN